MLSIVSVGSKKKLGKTVSNEAGAELPAISNGNACAHASLSNSVQLTLYLNEGARERAMEGKEKAAQLPEESVVDVVQTEAPKIPNEGEAHQDGNSASGTPKVIDGTVEDKHSRAEDMTAARPAMKEQMKANAQNGNGEILEADAPVQGTEDRPAPVGQDPVDQDHADHQDDHAGGPPLKRARISDSKRAPITEDVTGLQNDQEHCKEIDVRTANPSDVQPAVEVQDGVTRQEEGGAFIAVENEHNAIPITHYPVQDHAMMTLVNRRLNPMERSMREINKDVTRLRSCLEESGFTSKDDLKQIVEGISTRLGDDLKALRHAVETIQTEQRNTLSSLAGTITSLQVGLGRLTQAQARGCASGDVCGVRGETAAGPRYRLDDRNLLANGQGMLNMDLTRVNGQVPNPGRALSRPRPQNEEVEVGRDGVPFDLYRPNTPFASRVCTLVARQVTVCLLETPHENTNSAPIDIWTKTTSAYLYMLVHDTLRQFSSYAQAYHTLSTSLGYDSVELTWFTRPWTYAVVGRARRNYAAWDPPPTDDEWKSEIELLREVSEGYHTATERHIIYDGTTELEAAVAIAKLATELYRHNGYFSSRPAAAGGVVVSGTGPNAEINNGTGPAVARTNGVDVASSQMRFARRQEGTRANMVHSSLPPVHSSQPS